MAQNDAASKPQAVGIPQFKLNIKAILSSVAAISPDTKILLITTPPFNPSTATSWGRTVSRTKLFADAMKQVGAELDVPVVDIYGPLVAAAEKEEGGYERLFSDGIHFTDEGYKVVAAEVRTSIERHYPSLWWSNMPMRFPSKFFSNMTAPLVVQAGELGYFGDVDDETKQGDKAATESLE
ncbi:hypothetical protein MNV49_001117 [Pseudohyphozyma bogoriensis]|nr:hypothetical protein MNV49_001117 [Pseudohyphozyma bogoriensis]